MEPLLQPHSICHPIAPTGKFNQQRKIIHRMGKRIRCTSFRQFHLPVQVRVSMAQSCDFISICLVPGQFFSRAFLVCLSGFVSRNACPLLTGNRAFFFEIGWKKDATYCFVHTESKSNVNLCCDVPVPLLIRKSFWIGSCSYRSWGMM